jgi:pimeloyl-ACP methyl ester carboxylesterase
MAMQNPRTHGAPPFSVAVLHGGPGAGGEAAPVARALAARRGVLEPIQTATTIEGQVAELRAQLEAHAALPATIVGYSWGAWLAVLAAAAHPRLARRLVLVASGPFEERYVARLREARLARLDAAGRAAFDAALAVLGDPAAPEKDAALARLGALCAAADAFDPLPWETRAADEVACDGRLFERVWGAAAELRRTGALLEAAARVRCPVVAIHGAADAHPAEGVAAPLAAAIADFRLVLLERCGHTPWLERQARGAFFEALEEAVR